jgi:hypothetical protein
MFPLALSLRYLASDIVPLSKIQQLVFFWNNLIFNSTLLHFILSSVNVSNL